MSSPNAPDQWLDARAEERRGLALLFLKGTDEARRVLEGAAQLAEAAGCSRVPWRRASIIRAGGA
jgi:hypothetical protein